MEPQIGDAFGSALLDHLEGGDGLHVVERDDGFAEPMVAGIYFAEPDDWPERDADPLLHIRGRVLDIGAGGGRYAVELGRTGHEVVALDTSPGAIEVCRRRGVSDVFIGTVFELVDDSGFDTFLLAGNNIGLLENPAHAPKLLGRLRQLARPGARIVGIGRDPLATDATEHLAYHRLNLERGREAGQLRLRVRYRNVSTDWFEYWLIGPDELGRLGAASGWGAAHIEPIDSGSYLAVLELKNHPTEASRAV